MFNVTILKIKDLVNYIVIITIAIVAIVFLFKITSKKNLTNSLSTAVPVAFEKETEEKESEKTEESSQNEYMKKILKSQVSSIDQIEKKTEEDEVKESNEGEVEENNKDDGNEKQLTIQELPAVANTEIVTQNPIQENFNTVYEKVKIKNGTDYQLTDEILKPDITIENKNIIIFHTHTCESYTSSDAYPYTPTGNFRTSDLNFTVARVGNELEKYLSQCNYNVYHDITYHDYPAYNGSYTRSLETVKNILKSNPSDIIIDLHRDAIGSRSDYAPTVKINDDYAAQIMFVIGTNNGGLEHPNWNQNLKFAIKVQEKAEEMYPGLFKPIMLTKSRYNQHTGRYANIIEVGSTGNTLEQCITSMKYLAKVMNEILKE